MADQLTYASTVHAVDNLGAHSSPSSYPQVVKEIASFKAIIVDLDNLLISRNTVDSIPLPISRLTFRRICGSSVWEKRLRGDLSEPQAYRLLAEEFNLSNHAVQQAFQISRSKIVVDERLFQVLKRIQSNGYTVYGMTDISRQELEFVFSFAPAIDPGLFTRVFTYTETLANRPHLKWYNHVITEMNMDPQCTLFLDNKAENVRTARSTGMIGVLVENREVLIQSLKVVYGEDPVKMGIAFLQANKKKLHSYTSQGDFLWENFTQLLIWEATGDRALVHFEEGIPMNLFPGKTIPRVIIGDTSELQEFPDDYDCTSIAMTIFPNADEATKETTLDLMLKYRTSDGLTPLYFSSSRINVDMGCCVNTLTFFFTNGRGNDIQQVYDWIYSCLLHRAYLDGSLYYTVEMFLYRLSRFIYKVPEVRPRLVPLFKERITERFGLAGDATILAMRLIAAAVVGLDSPVDYDRLLELQETNGSWTGYFYGFLRTGMLVGNNGFSTAVAINAIEGMRQLRLTGQPANFRAWD